MTTRKKTPGLVTPRRTLIKPEEIWPPVGADDLKFCPAPPLVADGIYRAPGQYAWFRGAKDGQRWMERSQRQPTAEAILNNRLFDVDGSTVTVHVAGDTQWRFIFGRDAGGGGGQGKGGKAGQDGDSENDFDIDMSVDDLDDLLFKGLALPNLIGKKSQITELTGVKIQGLGKTGSRSEWARKDTIKQYLRRLGAAMAQDPSFIPDPTSGLLVPADKLPMYRSDQRYWQLEELRDPVSQAVVYILVDRSGSVTEQMLRLIYLFDFLMIRFLTRHYKHVKIVILGHTSGEPTEFESWQALVTDKMTGGTTFSPSLEWIFRHATENKYIETHNCYLVQGSDGDNFPVDRTPSQNAYRALLDAGFNYILYTEACTPGTTRWSDGAELLNALAESYRKNIFVGRIFDNPSVFAEFQKALAKDASRV